MARPPPAVPDVQQELLRACRDGELARVKQALEAGALVDPELGDRPLVMAATRGHTAVFQLLVDRGADVDRLPGTGDNRGRRDRRDRCDTPLQVAAQHDHAEIVGICLDALAAADVAWQRDAALLVAVRAGASRTVVALLERGAAPTAVLETGTMAASSYASGAATMILSALIATGGDLAARAADGRTLLHLACANAAVPTSWLDFLGDFGANIDARDGSGATALWHAARANQPERVAWLLARGADVNACTAVDSALAKAGTSVYDVARPVADFTLLAALRDAGSRSAPANQAVSSPGSNDPFAVGARVRHKTFGLGTIVAREGLADALKLTIEFMDLSGEPKKLLAKFVTTAG